MIKTKTGTLYMSRGNRKLKKTYIHNLPSGITCNPTELCRKICYAKKAEYFYPQVLPCRMNTLNIVQNDSSWVHAMVNKLRNGKLEYFRIHESGDFISQHYLNQWIAIAQAVPKIKFLAFTKMYQWNYSRIPSNMEIVFSVMSDSVNVPDHMPLAYAGDIQGMNNYLECSGQCGPCRACWNLKKLKKNIRFKLH